VQRIADAFRASHYDIGVAVRALLLSDAFWDPANRGTLVKSPVELVVGTLRVLHVDVAEPQLLIGATARMGEVLFAPPNVRGWPGGDAWINSATLLARKAFVARATHVSTISTMQATGGLTAAGDAADRLHASEAWQRVLLPLPAVGNAVAEALAEREPAAVIRAAMLDPVYQLK
jgi:uncharacterized protein (DUF1800 family)